RLQQGARMDDQALRQIRVVLFQLTSYSGRSGIPAATTASVVRIAAFGDSFTHCDGVANSFTWEYLLERLNPALEVLNFGVGGYGTDQALLRYELEGMAFHPHIAILGFLPENIHRVVSVFRSF